MALVRGEYWLKRAGRERSRERWESRDRLKTTRFKYLLKQLDGSGLLDIIRQVVPQTLTSYHERTHCVRGCTRAHARVHACVLYVHACMCVCVFACVCMCVCVYEYSCIYVCICVRPCVLFFIIHKTRTF